MVADTAHVPQPWREDAVVMGRDEAYNTERFLHELTFRHRLSPPAATEEGIRGTAGSVGSDRLYYDFRFLRDFGFREDRNGFLLDIQRAEDLDGAYDRQLIGFRQNLGDDSEIWLQGDVFSDKSQADVYFSARHHLTDNSWIHASWILPDAYFNDKTDTRDSVEQAPQTFFLQWHRQGTGTGAGTTLSLNLSPESRFISRQEQLTVDSESLRTAITHGQRAGDWLLRLHLEGERTRRDYQLRGPEESGSTPFDREYLEARVSATLTSHRLQPGIGLAYVHLDETGYFGRALDDEGRIRRREPTLFGEISLQAARNTTISPGLYLSAPKVRQSFAEDDGRRHSGFTGKLALPIEVQLPDTNQAVLTINPTFYLHKAAFGGGNLQLHWPL
ncbi:hypothetical protein [Marinobacter zhanjiangensis]|nr:hypothetical protein [Marinobacter zhanjiangensis]